MAYRRVPCKQILNYDLELARVPNNPTMALQ